MLARALRDRGISNHHIGIEMSTKSEGSGMGAFAHEAGKPFYS